MQAVEQLVVNGGFEQDASWNAKGDTFTYFSGESHSGNRSARSKAERNRSPLLRLGRGSNQPAAPPAAAAVARA